MTYCDEHGSESTFDDFIAPSIALMGSEREADHISLENQRFIVDTTRKVIVEIGGKFEKFPKNAAATHYRRLRARGVS